MNYYRITPMLNLLPLYQKERLRKEHVFLVVHAVVGLILVGVTVAATVLTIARVILVNEFTKLKHDTTLVSVEHLRLENDIDELNQKVSRTDKIQQSFRKTTALFSDLTKIIPAGVTINYLAVNRVSGALRLNGFAPNRESLIAAKTALETAPFIAKLDAPLSNFLEKENIEFRFSGQLKPTDQ